MNAGRNALLRNRGPGSRPAPRIVWQVELDPFCRSILARHFPDAQRFKDVRDVGATELGPVGIIAGGFPCQDISQAGTGAGLQGARSGLWFEFARIIRETRPRWVVVENVPALLARGFGRVLGDLAACGYDAIWDCLPAQAVGAPHRRDRLFVVAWRVPDPERDGVRDGPERGAGGAQAPDGGDPESLHVGEAVAHTDSLGRQRSEARVEAGEGGEAAQGRPCSMEWPPAPGDMHAWGRVPPDTQPAFCRVADRGALGLDRRNRLRALGNAVVPQVAEVIGEAIAIVEITLTPTQAEP